MREYIDFCYEWEKVLKDKIRKYYIELKNAIGSIIYAVTC